MKKFIILRNLMAGLLLAGLIPHLAFADSGKSAELESITVYKSPTCGCCGKWVSHLQDNGFDVEAIDKKDMGSVKLDAGIPRQLASCHTAIIGGYIIEGHVPAVPSAGA